MEFQKELTFAESCGNGSPKQLKIEHYKDAIDINGISKRFVNKFDKV